MALPTTGAISLSQVVAEFGGVAPHAMSEFYALLGKGVTGLPSSGVFNCSQFYGKSNQVITSVWTASGYNTSSSAWVMSSGSYIAAGDSNANGNWIQWVISGTAQPRIWGPALNSYITTASYGGQLYRRYAAGDYSYNQGGGNGWANVWSNLVQHYLATTTWTDTSAYQNTTTTAQITT
jgi:hypothetical protein